MVAYVIEKVFESGVFIFSTLSAKLSHHMPVKWQIFKTEVGVFKKTFWAA